MAHTLRHSTPFLIALVLIAGAPAPVTASSMVPPGSGRCGALTEITLPLGKYACTHGADPAPAGVDVRQPFDPANQPAGLLLPDPLLGPTTAAAGPPAPRCYGNGRTGNRVLAIYARTESQPDRYAEMLPWIRRWAGQVDAVVNASAAQLGATRHVRFVTDGYCQVVVERVVLPEGADVNLSATMAALAAKGYMAPSRKYLVWMDANVLCGIAAYYEDDRRSSDNLNNGNPTVAGVVARIDSGCWGLGDQGESIEAHELMHSLGSVQPTAPHATLLGHCTDESDRMCYEDGSALFLSEACASEEEALFDCDDDDYFNPAPPPGSYLATHWNTARSSFLAVLPGDVPVTVTGGEVVEGDFDTRSLAFTVSLPVPVNQTVRVSYTTIDGTAVAGDDYDNTAGVVEFAPGETAKTVMVPVRGDRGDETDEQFTLRLFDAVDAVVGGGPATGNIVDDDPKGQGYWLVATDGGIFSFADTDFYGSTGAVRLNQPIVGMATTPSGKGYWMVARDGGIFTFGDAGYHGSTGDIALNQPIVGMAATPSGGGYWLVAADGGVFAFGDANPSLGSTGGRALAAPIVAIAATPTGGGYWLAGRDGRVFGFGDASAFDPLPPLNQPIVGAAATASGNGLWLVAADGGIFAFGDAGFFGSTGDIRLNQPVVGMTGTPTGRGYWLVATDGGIFTFGDAGFFGSTGNIRLNRPVVGMSALP